MTKEECVQIVNAYQTAWNRDAADKDTYELWWRYFANRNFFDTMRALDWFVAQGGFPPRIADVYRKTIDLETGTAPLGPKEALSQANAVVDANNRGVEPPEVDAKVIETLRSLVKKGIRWSPGVFEEEYRTIVTEHYFGTI